MKFSLTLTLGAGLLIGVFFIHAQTPAASGAQLHLSDTFTSRGQAVILAADNIQRSESVIRMSGNVEIRLRPKNQDADVMVLRADAAEYQKLNDEITPRGNVRVTFEKPN